MGRGRRSLSRGPVCNPEGSAPVKKFINKGCGSPRSPSFTPKPSKRAMEVASTPISYNRRESPPLFNDESPLRRSPSPILFAYSQDGSHGENDVIWDFYSPLSQKGDDKVLKTPIRKRKGPANLEFSPISRLPFKRLPARRKVNCGNNMKLIQQLAAYNKRSNREPSDASIEVENVGRSDALLTPERTDSFEGSILVNNTKTETGHHSRNRFEEVSKCNNEAIESDDSINEYLFTVTQRAEEELKNTDRFESSRDCNKENKLLKRVEILDFVNDSFDRLISEINDSYMANLSQVPNNGPNLDNNNVSSGNLNDSRSKFGRHNSMPVSPICKSDKNSTNETKSTFIRHKSMPVNAGSPTKQTGSQSACTQEEIQKKREAAREKLLSKLQIPQQSKTYGRFIPKSSGASSNNNLKKTVLGVSNDSNRTACSCYGRTTCDSVDCKYKKDDSRINNVNMLEKIEKKRKEAQQRLLMKKLQLKSS